MPVAEAPSTADASPSAPPAPEVPASALYATYAVGFASNGVGMMLKVALPLWAITLQLSVSEIGIAVGMAGLMPFLLSIHGGVLMDRLGTRRVTMAYALATVIACPLYPALPFFAGVLALQLITGLAQTTVWVGAQSLIVRFTKGQTRLIARFSVAARLGTLLGPVIVGAIWDLADPWIAFGSIGVAGLLVLLALKKVPESDGLEAAPRTAVAEGAAPAPARERTRLRDLLPNWRDYAGAFSLLSIPAVTFIVVMTVLRNSSTGIQTSFYIVYLKDIGYLGTVIGLLVGISEGAGMAGALMAGWWEKYFKPHWVLIGFVIASIAFVSITPVLGGIFVLLAAATFGRGFAQGLTQPVIFGILARAVDARVQGTSIGLRTTSNRAASVIVPLVMGFVAEHVGLINSFYVCGGALIAITLGIALYVRRLPAFRS
jgi:MFS family permease